MRKPVLLVAMLCLSLPVLLAQDARPGWAGRMWGIARDRFGSLSKAYDTTFVYQIRAPWTAALNADLIWTGMETHSDITPQGSGSF